MKKINIFKRLSISYIMSLAFLAIFIIIVMSMSRQVIAMDIVAKNVKSTPYETKLQTLSLIGIGAKTDGTVDGTRLELAEIWEQFANLKISEKELVNRNKIYVVFYKNQEENNIFIGYPIMGWVNSFYNGKKISPYILDIPASEYLAFDVKGTSTNAIIKAWSEFRSILREGTSTTAIERYELNSQDASVQNVTLFLKNI